MDAKSEGNVLVLVGARTTADTVASHYHLISGACTGGIPRVDLALGPAAARAVAQIITDGLVRSAHDCSEGGVLVAVAEMLIASGDGACTRESESLADLLRSPGVRRTPALGVEMTGADELLEAHEWAFAENPSRYVLEIRPEDLPRVRTILSDFGATCAGLWHRVLGRLNASGHLTWPGADLDVSVETLATAWRAPLDW
jgi:phosphoribosylformylglycinamidine synthase